MCHIFVGANLQGVGFCATLPSVKTNKDWFVELINRKHGSMRSLAKKMKNSQGNTLDIASVSKMLNGKRPLTVHEAQQLSSLLDMNMSELLRQSGIKLPDEKPKPIKVGIVGYLDSSGELHLEADKSEEPIIGPSDLPKGSVAVLCRAGRSLYDGWLVFSQTFEPPTAEAVGRLCLYTLKAGGGGLGIVTRGYRAGTYDVEAVLTESNAANQEGVVLARVAPVLWIRPK